MKPTTAQRAVLEYVAEHGPSDPHDVKIGKRRAKRDLWWRCHEVGWLQEFEDGISDLTSAGREALGLEPVDTGEPPEARPMAKVEPVAAPTCAACEHWEPEDTACLLVGEQDGLPRSKMPDRAACERFTPHRVSDEEEKPEAEPDQAQEEPEPPLDLVALGEPDQVVEATKLLRGELTVEQKAEHADRMSEILSRVKALTLEKAESAKDYKQRIDALVVEAQQLGDEVKEGKEDVVAVETRRYFRANLRVVVRKDTGEVLGHRALEGDERQALLPGTDAPAQAEPTCGECHRWDPLRGAAGACSQNDADGEPVSISPSAIACGEYLDPKGVSCAGCRWREDDEQCPPEDRGTACLAYEAEPDQDPAGHAVGNACGTCYWGMSTIRCPIRDVDVSFGVPACSAHRPRLVCGDCRSHGSEGCAYNEPVEPTSPACDRYAARREDALTAVRGAPVPGSPADGPRRPSAPGRPGEGVRP